MLDNYFYHYAFSVSLTGKLLTKIKPLEETIQWYGSERTKFISKSVSQFYITITYIIMFIDFYCFMSFNKLYLIF